jgi:glycine/D-amino acid oxidase-like deaminating enzyme
MGSSLSRRELLGAFLGMPAAMAACRSSAPRLPPGEIVFPSQILGHKVRDGIPSSPSAWEQARVVIVGGGVAGLSAAWRLARAGFDDFVLLELDPAPGGTAKSGRNEVSAYPWGAHYVTVPMKENRTLLSLLGELGVVEGTDEAGEPVIGESYLCREPTERLFHEGLWYPGLYLHHGEEAEDRAELARFQSEMDRFGSGQARAASVRDSDLDLVGRSGDHRTGPPLDGRLDAAKGLHLASALVDGGLRVS